jgi:hypothetical protein
MAIGPIDRCSLVTQNTPGEFSRHSHFPLGYGLVYHADNVRAPSPVAPNTRADWGEVVITVDSR